MPYEIRGNCAVLPDGREVLLADGVAEGGRRERNKLKLSPRQFRKALLVDCDGVSRPFDSVLDPWQRKDFEALDPGWERMVGLLVTDRPPINRAYLERPRGHSKTTDLASMALWALFASPRKINGVAGAAAKKQAGLLRDGIDTLVRLNPWLADEIAVYKWIVYNKYTGSQFEILAANEATAYGLTPDFVIADELTHWPKEELWTALFSAVAKRANCVCVVIANAGMGQGSSWHWTARENARKNPRWHFHRLDGIEASWITEENKAEQRAILSPLAYRRLWLNIWLTNVGDALNIDALYRACVHDGPAATNPFDFAIGGLDMGLAHDHAGWIVLGIDIGKRCLRLLNAMRWSPGQYEDGRISFNDVESYVIADCKRLKVQGVAYDPWQCEHLAENVRRQQIVTYPFSANPKNAKRMATDIMEATNHGEVELYRDESLLTDLCRLNIVHRPIGYKIEAPKDETGHCDLAAAYAIGLPFALDALDQYAGRRRRFTETPPQ